MKTKIRIGVIGLVKNGEHAGSLIKVLDDSLNTGGFLILLGINRDTKESFDNWVENGEQLEKYFNDSGWIIEWTEVIG